MYIQCRRHFRENAANLFPVQSSLPPHQQAGEVTAYHPAFIRSRQPYAGINTITSGTFPSGYQPYATHSFRHNNTIAF